MRKNCCDRMSYDLEQTCRDHASRFDCPDALIAKDKMGFGIIVHDGGTSTIEISFCPWCGADLRQG